MASPRAVIDRSISNGPFVYSFSIDGVVQKAEISIATLNAAIDLIKPQIAAVPGTIDRGQVIVTTASASGVAVVSRVTTTGGPIAYTWNTASSGAALHTVATGVANFSAAIDAIKPLAAALNGAINQVIINVSLS